MSAIEIEMLIENKEKELAQAKELRDYYIEHYGYLMAKCDQEIYELNIQLQLAEAEEQEKLRTPLLNPEAAAFVPASEDEGWNAELVTRQPEPAHREGTKLKWVSSTNPETYSVAIVKKNGILEVKRVTDGAGHCHDATTCNCRPCSETRLSNRLGAPQPPWIARPPLLKTFFATEAEWRASLPDGGLRGSIKATVPAISEKTLKKLSSTPLTGTTDALKVKELEERFPGGTLVLTTSKGMMEIKHVYHDIATYPENWRHQIYCKKSERDVIHFTDLGHSPRSNGKPQLMAEWDGLYIDLSHLF